MTQEPVEIVFGPFCLSPAKRLLAREGTAVAIGGRALDLLIALVERPGRVLTKRELLKLVWPDMIVEEGSLRFHMAGLRKLLGADGEERYISTQVGVGYAFVAPLERRCPQAAPGMAGPAVPPAAAREPPGHTTHPAGGLPPRETLIGREADVDVILERLKEPKLLTVVGPGGVGKTSVAVEIGHRLREGGHATVRFADLTQLETPALVPYVLAAALGITVQGADPVPVLLAQLPGQDLLLILDNCEHVIDAIADLAERIRDRAPRVSLLATSREPLRVRDEHVHWLGSMECPDPDAALSVKELLSFPAVRFFVARVSASNSQLRLADEDIRLIADICRRLEGMALALELAAVRMARHGVQATRALLGERFSLGWPGRRTAPPRQQTLRATLDWSYDLLTGSERLTFERLSVFVGPFPLEAAALVAADDTLEAVTAVAALDSLVAKSLVSVDEREGAALYRLLDMTRAYAREKLSASGESGLTRVAQRHAACYLQHLSHRGATPEEVFERASRLSSQLGNIRSALEWSFGPAGSTAIAVPLAAASAPMFEQLSLMAECRDWCGRAVQRLDADTLGTATELELQAALGLVLMFTQGNSDAAEAALRRALAIAVALQDRWNQLRILGRLQIFHERVGDFATSMTWADQALEVGRQLGEPEAIAVAASLAGVSHHLLGDQRLARQELERSLQHSLPYRRDRTVYYGFDHRNRSCIALARTLWLQGCPEAARLWAARAESEARALNHPVTHCIALIWTLSVHIWAGDAAGAQGSLATFAHAAQANLFRPYIAAAGGFAGLIALLRGEVAQAADQISESLATLQALRYELLTTSFQISLTEALMRSGRHVEAMSVATAAIEFCERSGDAFALPELLRIKAGILCALGADNEQEAEAALQSSIELSERQGSRAWHLRSGTDLAQLWLRQQRRSDARTLLRALRADITGGPASPDAQRAEALWESLRGARR